MRKTGFVLAISILLASCLKNKTQECNYNDSAFQAPAAEVTALQDYLTMKSITASSNPAGFFYNITTVGSGVAISNLCSTISVNYKGTLTDGKIFDASEAGAPATFQLGQLIPGWQKGIPLISKGGKITLYIPPSLAYGSVDRKDDQGNIVIPANSNLIFEIELVDVVNQ